MAEITHSSTIAEMLVDIAATIRASEITENTDFRGASKHYLLEKINEVENELKIMKAWCKDG